MVKIPEYVQSLKAYKPGNLLDLSDLKVEVKEWIKLGSNENALGPSPKAIEAIKECAANGHEYPDPGAGALIDLIAEKYNKKQDQIICGNGSNALIQHIVNAFSDVNDEILTAAGTFVGILVNAWKLGRKLNLVPLKDYKYDLDAIAEKINPNTKIVYLSNPNNPTGTLFTKAELDAFIPKVPKDVLIVFDEAYYSFCEEIEGYPNGMEYDLPNMIVLRTFSKSHGLAGLRIGFAVGPEDLITTLYKVKFPFEPNILAQAAATAAIKDDDFVKEVVETNKTSLKMMMDKFDELGIKYVDPTANFVMILLDSEEKAGEFARECMQYGIIVRHVNSFGVPNGVRINSATVGQTKYVVDVFDKIFKEM
ncbi:MAG: histidinol-phosphate transaminase [bacterium]|nr:histidinol-phosphate transaminase [bacterium]